MKKIFCNKWTILIAINIVFFLSAKSNSDSAKFDFKSRFIRSWSITPGAFMSFGPRGACPTNVYQQGYVPGMFTTMGMLYHHNFRYNLFEMNSSNAIGLNFSPNIGVSMLCLNFDVEGIHLGQFSLPLYVSYEFGAGSTYDAEDEVGFSLGFGIEYNILPIFSFGDDLDPATRKYMNRSYFNPIVTFSKRSWSKFSPYLNSYNFKVGAYPYTIKNYATNTDEQALIFSFTFSFGNFINY